jgi:hypothetical protein
MADDAPQWLRDAFAAQSQQLAELAAQQANTMANLATRIDSIDERTMTPNPSRIQTPPPLHIPSQTLAIKRPKHCLPNPDKFDGEDATLYPQFEGLLRAKLEIDGEAIGGEKERVWYGFGRLSGGAASQIFPWLGYAQKEGKFTVEGLFKQMDIAFRDPRKRQKALGELNRIRQKSRSFGEFLSDFNRLILEAEGWGWQDEIKKAYLKAAISTELMEGFVGTKEEESYDDYCSQLRMTSDQLVEVKDMKSRRSNWAGKRSKSPPLPRAASPTQPMEWEPTVGSAKQQTSDEPRWASREEVERRRQTGLCLRCGREDHFVRHCQAKARASPPSLGNKKKKRSEDERPKAKTKDVKVARTGPKKAKKAKKVHSRSSDTPDESMSEDEESSSSSGSGKD